MGKEADPSPGAPQEAAGADSAAQGHATAQPMSCPTCEAVLIELQQVAAEQERQGRILDAIAGRLNLAALIIKDKAMRKLMSEATRWDRLLDRAAGGGRPAMMALPRGKTPTKRRRNPIRT